MAKVHVYPRTVEHTPDPVEFGDEGILACSIESFLFACRQTFQCRLEQWYATERGKPTMIWEIFDHSGMDQFSQRADVPFLLIQHDPMEVSRFDERMPLVALLAEYYGGIGTWTRDIFLCITVLEFMDPID
jgi:hypothetical protein